MREGSFLQTDVYYSYDKLMIDSGQNFVTMNVIIPWKKKIQSMSLNHELLK